MTPMLRAFRLLARPKAEWGAIAGDAHPPHRLLLLLVLPLGILGALAVLFAPTVHAGLTPRFPGTRWIVTAVLMNIAIPIAMIGAAAFAAHGFAASVGAERDRTRAVALAAFAATPYLLIGIVRGLVPSLLSALIGLAAIVYAVMLVHLGARPMTGVPDDRVLPYTTAIVGFAVVAQYAGYVLMMLIVAMF